MATNAPELAHFRAPRDSLRDMEGTPWVGMVAQAVAQMARAACGKTLENKKKKWGLFS